MKNHTEQRLQALRQMPIPDVWENIKDAPLPAAAQAVPRKKVQRQLLAACLLLVLLAALAPLAAKQLKQPGILPPQATAEKSTQAASESQPQGGSIKVMELQENPNREARFPAMRHAADFVPMSMSELAAYYGTDILPTALPNDLHPTDWKPGMTAGIYRRASGAEAGTVYDDQNNFLWTDSKDASRYQKSIVLTVAKGALPFHPFADISADTLTGGKAFGEQSSVILGTQVLLGHYKDENEFYYAQFFHKNVGFELEAQNVALADFTKTIESILK